MLYQKNNFFIRKVPKYKKKRKKESGLGCEEGKHLAMLADLNQ